MILVSIQKSNINEIRNFDCGISDLNNYFYNHALFNDINNIGKTFVLYDENKIIGFYTLCGSCVMHSTLPQEYQSKLPKYPIPGIKIARLAVDIKYQNKGIGHLLMRDIFKMILSISNKIGIYFILVDAKETSLRFYYKFGFTNLPNSKLNLILPISTL